MFSKIALFAAASMAILVAAAPAPSGGVQDSCNTGTVQCCNQVYDSKSSEANLLASLVGAALGPLTAGVGANCSPLSGVGVGGNSCTQQPVCCSGNNFNGLVVIGCSPININL